MVLLAVLLRNPREILGSIPLALPYDHDILARVEIICRAGHIIAEVSGTDTDTAFSSVTGIGLSQPTCPGITTILTRAAHQHHNIMCCKTTPSLQQAHQRVSERAGVGLKFSHPC